MYIYKIIYIKGLLNLLIRITSFLKTITLNCLMVKLSSKFQEHRRELNLHLLMLAYYIFMHEVETREAGIMKPLV